MAEVVKFACLTGLRPAEVCESVRLLKNNNTNNIGAVDDTSSRSYYYNEERQALEHFRFPEVFLGRTKKAYISFVTLANLQPIVNLGPKTPSWDSIRLAFS
jgi:hypothetical protein